ncbi:hypothetical protein ABW286_04115 [Erwinia papayae]|uniref:Uncharacterized protein n=1 Tax=Erwinia papayae TaxID=206499 RepID=A0ABV3MXU5_9GAMM
MFKRAENRATGIITAIQHYFRDIFATANVPEGDTDRTLISASFDFLLNFFLSGVNNYGCIYQNMFRDFFFVNGFISVAIKKAPKEIGA